MEQQVLNFFAALEYHECKAIRGSSQNCIIITAKVNVLLSIQQEMKKNMEHSIHFHPTEIKRDYTVTRIFWLKIIPFTERQNKIVAIIHAAKQRNEMCLRSMINIAFQDTETHLIAADLRYLQGEGLITKDHKNHWSYVPVEISERNRGISISYVN